MFFTSNLNQSDLRYLIKLLQDSESVGDRDRKGLCEDLGLKKPGSLPFLNGGTDDNFATQLIHYLHNTKNQNAIILLCEKLEEKFEAQADVNSLKQIKNKCEKIFDFKEELRQAVSNFLQKNSLYRDKSDPKQPHLIVLDFEPKPDKPCPSLGDKIFNTFNEKMNNENRIMIISGKPGAGKTTILLKLADEIIKPDQAKIPLLLNLSLWNDNYKFSDWVIEQLHILYNYNISDNKLFDMRNLVLLLDGFDEIESENSKERFLGTLNDFMDGNINTRVVLCTTAEKNQNLDKIESNVKLELQPLNDTQIQQFCDSKINYKNFLDELDSLSKNLTNENKQQCINNINQLKTNPLFIEIIVELYKNQKNGFREKLLDQDLQNGSEEELKNKLLDSYINLIIKRDLQKKYPKTKKWLTWLAKQMEQERKTLFLIENMQPNWLTQKKDQIAYYLIVSLIVGLLCGLCSGLLSEILNYDPNLKSTPYFPIAYILPATLYGILSGLASGVISILFKKRNHRFLITLIIAILSGLIYFFGINFVPIRANIQVLDMIIFAIFFGYIFYMLDIENIKPVHSIDFFKNPNKKAEIHFKIGMVWAFMAGTSMLILLILCDLNSINNTPFSNPWLSNFITKTITPLTDINKSVINTNIENIRVLFGGLTLVIFILLNVWLLLGYERIFKIAKFLLGSKIESSKTSPYLIINFVSVSVLFILILLAIISIFFGITSYIRFSLTKFDNVLLGLLSLELFVGIQVAIIFGFEKKEGLEILGREPNSGIKKTLNNSVKLLIICGLISGLVSSFFWWIYSRHAEIIWWIFYRGDDRYGFIYFGAFVGLIVGLLSAMVNGEASGLVLVKHSVLRVILWVNDYTPRPWEYVNFLDKVAGEEAPNLLQKISGFFNKTEPSHDHKEKPTLLQKFGGSYQFKHRIFLEYFNKLDK